MAGGGSDNSGKKMLKWEKQQVKDAEKKEAERQAHSAKGLAATIGADGLHQAALALEQAFRQLQLHSLKELWHPKQKL
jgi:HPt (histidine-containing phosphotransfer) domain-containing protein